MSAVQLIVVLYCIVNMSTYTAIIAALVRKREHEQPSDAGVCSMCIPTPSCTILIFGVLELRDQGLECARALILELSSNPKAVRTRFRGREH